MAVYRKIDCRISNDKKFRELSVEGKLAWYTILSRRDLGPIGAFKASFESLASEQRGNKYLHEMVDETVTQTVSERFSKIFTKALHELLEKGFIKYDSESFLVYVPNFLKYNFPENPNVVKSWNSTIDALPECELTNFVFARSAEIIFNSQKDNLIKVLPKEFVEAYKKQYAEGFNKPFLNGSLNGISNQKQKHKQEQEQKNNEDASSKIAETSLTETEKDSLSSAPSLETPKKKTAKKSAKTSAVLKRPEDVPEELWKDFLEHRKLKKAPVTNRVLVLLRNEAKKAGWTLEAVINRIILRDWTGFEAFWVKDEWIERLPGTGDKPIMVKREDFMRDQFVASDLSMFTPEAADLIQSVGVQNTRPFKDRIKPLKNVHSEKNVSNPSKVSSEDLSTDIDAFNDIPDDFKEGGER